VFKDSIENFKDEMIKMSSEILSTGKELLEDDCTDGGEESFDTSSVDTDDKDKEEVNCSCSTTSSPLMSETIYKEPKRTMELQSDLSFNLTNRPKRPKSERVDESELKEMEEELVEQWLDSYIFY
jgi:hypothetical protein